MILTNNTKYVTDWATGYQKDGREQLVIITKATYRIPENGKLVELAEQQTPLITADISTGEPGYSATLYETDYSSFKPRCDVLFNGCACAPDGEYVEQLDVSLQLDSLVKSFVVKGNRTWGNQRPKSFNKIPITYDNAFGGTDTFDVKKFHFFRDNPIGTGYSYHQVDIDKIRLPNTEQRNHPVTSPKGAYQPMSLGSIGRSWPQRAQYAGTYDQEWIENRMPFWPSDFDFQFFQSAPIDQQCAYLNGGEQITLIQSTL